MTGPLISIVILTLNEELNLPGCLASLESLNPKEVFVVDSGSTDQTANIARNWGARVIEHEFKNQAAQLNWALENLPLQGEWVLRLDADERLTPHLAAELASSLPSMSPEITAFNVRRRVFFMGRWIRHGGYYPTWLLRIWRRGAARCEMRAMDEHMVVLRGATKNLRHDIEEHNLKGLFLWIERQNQYSTREVKQFFRKLKAMRYHLPYSAPRRQGVAGSSTTYT